MDDVTLLATILFAETKDAEDAKNIANVIKNRMARPQRFGATLSDVIYQPSQFSGVGSPEWNKVGSGKMNKDEEKIYKQFLSISHQALTGKLEDKTKGADHYFNPKLANPSWAKKMTKTTETKHHVYYKE